MPYIEACSLWSSCRRGCSWNSGSNAWSVDARCRDRTPGRWLPRPPDRLRRPHAHPPLSRQPGTLRPRTAASSSPTSATASGFGPPQESAAGTRSVSVSPPRSNAPMTPSRRSCCRTSAGSATATTPRRSPTACAPSPRRLMAVPLTEERTNTTPPRPYRRRPPALADQASRAVRRLSCRRPSPRRQRRRPRRPGRQRVPQRARLVGRSWRPVRRSTSPRQVRRGDQSADGACCSPNGSPQTMRSSVSIR